MAELNEHATVEEIKASYRRNASYEEDGDVTKAKRFVTAIRFILGLPMRARKGGIGGGETEFDTATLHNELAAAQRFIADNDTTAIHSIDVDFTEFDSRK